MEKITTPMATARKNFREPILSVRDKLFVFFLVSMEIRDLWNGSLAIIDHCKRKAKSCSAFGSMGGEGKACGACSFIEGKPRLERGVSHRLEHINQMIGSTSLQKRA
jgi:hypothetical protein